MTRSDRSAQRLSATYRSVSLSTVLMSRSLLLWILVTLASAAHAQDATRRVILTDGTVLVGTVVDEAADPVVVLTAGGVEQRVPRDRLARIEPLVGGRFTRADPTRTRLVFSPTGRTLGRRGQTRLGLLAVVVPNVTYAASSRVDVGTAGILSFGSDGGGGVLVPGVKVQAVDAPGLAVALGASAAIPVSTGDDFDGSFALTPYVAATLGNDVRAATLGVTGFFGASLSSGDVDVADGVLVSLGGEIQVSNSVKVIGEVLVPVGAGETGVLVLPGVRFFGDRFAADLFGFIASIDGEVGGFAPLGSFTYNF